MQRGGPLPAPCCGLLGANTPRPEHFSSEAASADLRLAPQYSMFASRPRALRCSRTQRITVWFDASIT